MNHLLYSVHELERAMGAEPLIQRTEVTIRTLLTDSRKLHDTAFGLFFALQNRRDGHVYLQDAYQAGVRSFVISSASIDSKQFPEANFYLVKDTLQALQDLAAHHRAKFNYPVLAITGSNGKTVVKEWLFQVLSAKYKIVRSPKSYNSQLGVALALWEMTEAHNLAIIEAGISKPGEMAKLARMIRPTMGVLTHMGEAHAEGFSSFETKLSEKLKLFSGVQTLVISDEYAGACSVPTFVWGKQASCDLQVQANNSAGGRTLIYATYQQHPQHINIPFTDAASIENATCCWATLLALGEPIETIFDKMSRLQAVEMRLELKNGINNCAVIDDSYSCDVSSLAIALSFLKQQQQHEKHSLILSDISESSLSDETLYKQIANLVEETRVSRFIGVGPRIGKFARFFPKGSAFYDKTADLIAAVPDLNFANESILIKGARAFAFEQISAHLVQQVHETVLEINLNALEANLNYYRSQLKEGVKVMAMVKAFSYGSGSAEIANLLQFNRVDYLAVAYADEGVALRQSGITLPIMVMNPDIAAIDTIIQHELEPEIYSLRTLNAIDLALKKHQKERYPVHIKLDTGMHRLGFTIEELPQVAEMLSNSTNMKVQSVFSHLAAAEDSAEDAFTQEQINVFTQAAQQLSNRLGYSFIRHLANTSGTSRWKAAQFDMVRLGIGLYGIDKTLPAGILQVVSTLKTTVSQLKPIKPTDTIGYNRLGKLPNGGIIATVKIGYADGYPRGLGNGVGKMLVNGQLVPTIGSICMDMCMLDVTGVSIEEGDQVIVFNQDLPVENLAKSLNTISYEVLSGISQRVKRVYYYE
ncbi:MAG: bifunctional UDP-N-acetylmuramoyl-tripeptide:D-alanyl-D-alanine ligase/alanine racemase [Sphingobacteriaceae bacterium]